MGINASKRFGALIRKAQDRLEQRAGTLVNNESVLQQDRLWLRSVTWTLIGTTLFGLGRGQTRWYQSRSKSPSATKGGLAAAHFRCLQECQHVVLVDPALSESAHQNAWMH